MVTFEQQNTHVENLTEGDRDSLRHDERVWGGLGTNFLVHTNPPGDWMRAGHVKPSRKKTITNPYPLRLLMRD